MKQVIKLDDNNGYTIASTTLPEDLNKLIVD